MVYVGLAMEWELATTAFDAGFKGSLVMFLCLVLGKTIWSPETQRKLVAWFHGLLIPSSGSSMRDLRTEAAPPEAGRFGDGEDLSRFWLIVAIRVKV
jgi:hypothetical protein